MKLFILSALGLNAIVDLIGLYLLQIEVPGQKGFEAIAITALGGTIVALAMYIKSMHKEQKQAAEKTSNQMMEMQEKTVKKYEELSNRNTDAFYSAARESQAFSNLVNELSRLIRERLK